ncbi:hypothetical protein CMQ_7925 [Grosmannia clavigera kw1407]|uniref:BAH domain-containing protein n=1 Tax=Grosmannia clavigera (strain kw1407 / UAMH 11150) TaxID=655863 RepID=F0XRY5_GROCL|nr:uncharacterized protein CMQ_7925 [Grosmannia clavigera kw1407]EFW99557.1 hypothetical protein CMQ_7925 [Grosmannia clavigera kw1407]
MTQSTSTKRPRQDTEDNRAECPFTIRLVDPKEKELKVKSKKRRKRGHNSSASGNHEDDDSSKKVLQQCAPFAPKGSFETFPTMDVHYVVEPARQWAEMTRYNSFVLNGVKYYCEGFIFVANDSSIERQKSAGPRDPRKRSEDDWVARILEIRASDEHHVYARVFWMYWPDELPAGTHYGKKTVQGRQPYHGAAELIASNHMDIINVVSVTSAATVNHLIEDRDDELQSALYWRQALDVRNFELSTIEVVCDCNQPANPDRMLVGCGDKSCGKWIHEECLKHYALMRVYEQLGKDQPHISSRPDTAVKPETGKDEVKEPLSPKETGGAVSAQHSIDVKADTVEVGGKDEDEEEEVTGRRRTTTINGLAAAPSPSPAAAGADGSKVTANGEAELALRDKTTSRDSLKREVTPASFEGKKKPYDQLFEAKLLLGPVESAPTMIEIRDLRTGVTGGDETWLEPAECPICSSHIG